MNIFHKHVWFFELCFYWMKFGQRSWEMKVDIIRCFWKLAEWHDFKNKWCAGGMQKTFGKKKNPGTVSKTTRQHLYGHHDLSATQVLKFQKWVKLGVQAVSNGNKMTNMCITMLFHMNLY